MLDWARKPYLTKKSYPEMIRQTPARAFWNSITNQLPVFSEYGRKGQTLTAIERRYLQFLKQSEAKKPYTSDDYQDMEYEWEGLPGLQDGVESPKIDHPWMDVTPVDINNIVPAEPGVWILQAFTNDKWCPGKQQILIQATHPIYDIEWTFPSSLKPGTSFSLLSDLGQPTLLIELIVDGFETAILSMRAYLEAFDAPPLPSTQGRGWTGFTIQEESISECPAFIFNLTRADGAAVPLDLQFTVWNPIGGGVAVTSQTDGSGKFVVTINSGVDVWGAYWVSYKRAGTDLVETQYPFLYKTADKFQNGDLIAPGEYTDQVHFFDVEDKVYYPAPLVPVVSPSPCAQGTWPLTSDYLVVGAFPGHVSRGTVCYRAEADNRYEASVIVNSSVDYRVVYSVPKAVISVKHFMPFEADGAGSCTGLNCNVDTPADYPWDSSGNDAFRELTKPNTFDYPSCGSHQGFCTDYSGLTVVIQDSDGVVNITLGAPELIDFWYWTRWEPPVSGTAQHIETSPSMTGKQHSIEVTFPGYPLPDADVISYCTASIFCCFNNCINVPYGFTQWSTFNSSDYDAPDLTPVILF